MSRTGGTQRALPCFEWNRWNTLHMHSLPCLSASEQAFLFFRTQLSVCGGVVVTCTCALYNPFYDNCNREGVRRHILKGEYEGEALDARLKMQIGGGWSMLKALWRMVSALLCQRIDALQLACLWQVARAWHDHERGAWRRLMLNSNL